MRIGCLQFAPQVGDVNNNLNRADSVLNRADPEDLDLLVLPELAFTGYNFKSLRDISPYLEPSGSGVSSLWARTTALKYECTVITGYPEKVDVSDRWPTSPEYYNSAIVVNGDGETIANYRKSHLYYTDETWALEGPSGFYSGRIRGLGRTAMGICMDINPYKFENPWDQFEFAHHALDCGAHLIIIPMAWLTHEDPREWSRTPQEPDMQTLMYWIARLEPIIRLESDHEIIVVFANRTGTEDSTTYAGTSAVVGIKDGEVLVYGVLGRGDKELLVVDTDEPPFAKLVHPTETPLVPAAEPQVPPESSGHESSRSGHSGGSDNSRTNVRQSPPEPPRELPQEPERYVSRRHDDRAQAPRFNESERGSAEPRSVSFNQSSTDSRPHETSSFDNMDSMGRHLDQHPSRGSSSNGYLNIHNGQAHEARSSHGQTPDSHQHRQGSASDLNHRSRDAPLQSRKPNWGQLPDRTDSSGWDLSDDEYIGDADEDWDSEQDVSPWGRENRRSIRSDVSVWNNFSGRSKPTEAPYTPQSRMITQKVEEYLRGSTPMSESQQDFSRFPEPLSAKKLESRSRQTTSRTQEQGSLETSKSNQKQSGQSGQSGPSHQPRSTNKSQTRSARATSVKSITTKKSATFSPERRDLRAVAGPSSSARISSSAGHREGFSTRAASIPIAMDMETWHASRESSLGPQVNPAPAEDDLPILRPASRSRLRDRSESTRGRAVEAPPPSKPANVDPTNRMTSSATGYKESRQHSRGRQRMTRSALDHQPQPSSSSRVSHSAQNSRGTPAEPIDLSQFNLIEEFPSVNCPVHGSRSRSAARHGTGSRRRISASGHRRPGSRDIRDSRRTTQNTPAQQAPPVPAPSSTPARAVASSSARKSSRDPTKKEAIATRKMTQSVQIGVKDPRPARNLTAGDRMVVTELTRLDLKQGPKTPVAMVLMGEAMDQGNISPEATTPLTSFGVRGSNVGTLRPRSAIW